MKKINKAFTLIELLVVISIIGILIAVSLFGIQGTRESSRDARRKSDLEMIRGGIEIYRSDCNEYPDALGTSLVGSGSPTSCALTNTYIAEVPTDPLDPARDYLYAKLTDTTYEICAALEQGEGTVTCGGSSDCGETCNYKVANP